MHGESCLDCAIRIGSRPGFVDFVSTPAPTRVGTSVGGRRRCRIIRSEPSTEDAATSLADRDQLERGFRRLKPEQRVVVVLHFYVGLPVPEIADTLGIPTGTVKSRLHYATATLRAALEADARETVAPNG